MIKVEDLRVRNTIEYKEERYNVTEIFFNKETEEYIISLINHQEEITEKVPLKLINPVNLTDNILIEYGFNNSGKEEDSLYYRHITLGIGITNQKGKFYFKYSDKIGDIVLYDCIFVPVQSLHQLQNLIHLLTGSEIIKLD